LESETNQSKLESYFVKKYQDCGYEHNNTTILKMRRGKNVEETFQQFSEKEEEGMIKFDESTILIFDKFLHNLPWESIPILKSKTVSRMPSLLFLYNQLLNKEFEYDFKKFTYLINPSNEFQKTEDKFVKLFDKYGWTGKINNKRRNKKNNNKFN
jgi:hypothetical protein